MIQRSFVIRISLQGTFLLIQDKLELAEDLVSGYGAGICWLSPDDLTT